MFVILGKLAKNGLRLQESEPLDLFERVDEEYGVEEEGFATGSDDGAVEVPAITIRLEEDQLAELCQMVDPLSGGDDFGINLYERTVQFVTSVLS